MINFSGLATGLDSASIIDSLVSLERLPINRLETKSAVLDAKTRKLNTLKTRLEGLSAASKAVDTRTEAQPSRADSADPGVLGVVASGSALPGSYDVIVGNLASGGKVRSDAFSARDQTGLFGSGTIDFQVGGGAAVSITVDGSSTLDSVVNSINTSGGGLQAAVVYDGTDYFLRVASTATGSANNLTITESGVTLGVSSPGNVLASATDASFSVDGIAMTRGTNTVVDAVPGTTLTLNASSAGTPVRVTVNRDNDALRDRLQSFVDAYNGVDSFLRTEFAYTGTTKSADSLGSDAALRAVQSRLRTALTNTVAGTSGRYDTLASIGIKLRNDGSLELDKVRFDATLAEDPDAIANVLSGATGAMSSIDAIVNDYTDATTGVIAGRTKSHESQKREIRSQVERLELRIDKFETRLRVQFAALEQLTSTLQGQGQQLNAIFSSNPTY